MKMEIADAWDLLTVLEPLCRMNAKDSLLQMQISGEGVSFVAKDAQSSITALIYLPPPGFFAFCPDHYDCTITFSIVDFFENLHHAVTCRGGTHLVIYTKSGCLNLLFLDSYRGEYRDYYEMPMTVTEFPRSKVLAPLDNPMRLHGRRVWMSPYDFSLHYFESLQYNPLPRTHTLMFGPYDPARWENFAWVTPTTGSLRLNFTESMKNVIHPMDIALQWVDSAWIMTSRPRFNHPEFLLQSFRFPFNAEIRFILPPQWVPRGSYKAVRRSVFGATH